MAEPRARDAVGVLYAHWTDWEEGLIPDGNVRRVLSTDCRNVRRALVYATSQRSSSG